MQSQAKLKNEKILE